MEDALEVLAVLVDGILDGCPYGVRAGHVQFPVSAYCLELGEIDQNAVLDGLGTAL